MKPHLLLMLEDVNGTHSRGPETPRGQWQAGAFSARGRPYRVGQSPSFQTKGSRLKFAEPAAWARDLPLLLVISTISKRYNDNYGHPMGDACLITVSKVMQGLFKRGGDLVARIGGEEFAILLPENAT